MGWFDLSLIEVIIDEDPVTLALILEEHWVNSLMKINWGTRQGGYALPFVAIQDVGHKK